MTMVPREERMTSRAKAKRKAKTKTLERVTLGKAKTLGREEMLEKASPVKEIGAKATSAKEETGVARLTERQPKGKMPGREISDGRRSPIVVTTTAKEIMEEKTKVARATGSITARAEIRVPKEGKRQQRRF